MRNVVEFPRPPAVLSTVPSTQKGCASQREQCDLRDQIEGGSPIIKAATIFTSCQAAREAGYIADKTFDGLYAGYDGIVGDKYVKGSERALAKLARLVNRADVVMTVELRSLTKVAGFIMKEKKDHGYEIEAEREDFLRAFAGLIDRLAEAQHERECKAARQ
jgi:hypothetical protein